MKQSIRTLSLTTLALAAALAVSAHAGTPSFSSAIQTHEFGRSVNPIHRLLFPTSTYMIDDGTAEDAVGFGNGAQNFQSVWANQFEVIPGQTTITSLDIAWGTPNFIEPIDGTPVTIGIWSDPNGDGSPTDAVLLGQVSGTIQNAGTDTFVNYAFSPAVALPAGATSFFVGDLTPSNSGPEHFFQGIDENSTLFRQSWVVANSSGADVDINNLGNNDFISIIDDQGLPGNWLIRANAGTTTGLTLLSAFSEKGNVLGGPWDIDLPLTGGGVEDRNGGPHARYSIDFVFNHQVVSAASKGTTTCGSIAAIDFDDANNTVKLELTDVRCNASQITITLTNLVDDQGDTLASASITFCLLIGDVNGDGVVDTADLAQVKADKGQPTDATNFREDVNNSGTIDAQDVTLVKKAIGTSCP